MSNLPTITTFAWVPTFAQGYVRDIRARWAFEETGQDYAVELIEGRQAKAAAHRRSQPFGQVPTYSDGVVEIFESGAIVLRIAERAPGLLGVDPAARFRAIQWLIAALNSVEPWVMQLAVVDAFEADREWSKPRRPSVVEALQARLAAISAALGDRPWLDGDQFTVGDLMMISVLGDLRTSDMLSAHPTLAAYLARGEGRPAYGKAMADHLAVFAEPADARRSGMSTERRTRTIVAASGARGVTAERSV